MNLYYVVAIEQTKDRKGAVQEVESVHAIIAKDEQHLEERCAKLFVKFDKPLSCHKLNKDWDCWKE